MSILKRLESYFYTKFNRYQRTKYANHDLQCKLRNIHVKPISDIDMDRVKRFYSKFGISVSRKWFDLFNSFNTDGSNICFYIPHDIYYGYIDTFYSDVRKSGFCDDKILYGVYFHDVKQPKTILRRCCDEVYLDEHYKIITKKEAVAILKNYDQFIVKKSAYSSGGKGVFFYNKKDDNTINGLLAEEGSIVIQEILKQHPNISYLHDNSVNTIRIISLIRNDKVNILSSVIRMGQGGAKVDNASSGGIFCGIKPNGQLKNIAYNCNGKAFSKHPQGAIFSNVTIPNFDECIKLVEKLAPRVSSITKLCSWDIAIDKDGSPILIEANFTFGEVDFHQMCNGPIFGNLTEAVLNDVFNTKR